MSNKLPDLYLAALKSLTDGIADNGEPTSFGVTVNSNGVVYSGKLVSESAWLDSVSKLLGTSSNNKYDDLASSLKAVKKACDDARAEDDASTEIDDYLHLIDASIVHGGHLSSTPPVRIAQSSVAAWSFGIASYS